MLPNKLSRFNVNNRQFLEEFQRVMKEFDRVPSEFDRKKIDSDGENDRLWLIIIYTSDINVSGGEGQNFEQ